MLKHSETRFLPYTPQQLFDLVADIERYPEFLPWCLEARILARDGDVVKADLIVGYKAFREKFTSVVTLMPVRAIDVTYVSGPLSHLTNSWAFTPTKGGCTLGFDLAFAFRTPLLAAIFGAFFDRALKRMTYAFEDRAHALYDHTRKPMK